MAGEYEKAISIKDAIDGINTGKDFLVDGASLEFSDFSDFFEKRRLALKERLKSRVFMFSALPVALESEDSDEEVVEEKVL